VRRVFELNIRAQRFSLTLLSFFAPQAESRPPTEAVAPAARRSLYQPKDAKNGLKPEDRGNIDVAWIDRNTLVVIEVKSTTPQNETKQLRLGLGQVLDYQDVEARGFDSVRAVLAIEQPPSDERWIRLCARHGVELVWRETFSSLFS